MGDLNEFCKLCGERATASLSKNSGASLGTLEHREIEVQAEDGSLVRVGWNAHAFLMASSPYREIPICRACMDSLMSGAHPTQVANNSSFPPHAVRRR